MPEEYRALERLAKQEGWTITRAGKRNSHLAWRPPNGRVVFTPSTPSANGSGILRVMQKLRKAGLPI